MDTGRRGPAERTSTGRRWPFHPWSLSCRRGSPSGPAVLLGVGL